jgi:transcription-repair coupling factor (superfamily II helicase)
MFGKILHYLQQNTRRCRIREKNERRSIAITAVPTVEEAVHILSSIHSLDTI